MLFISNGQLVDVIVLATKTDSQACAHGVTLFLVDAATPGFNRGQNLEKLGMKAQDTSELFFDNMRIPESAMLGGEGDGFKLMMTKLPQERLAQDIRRPEERRVGKKCVSTGRSRWGRYP